MKLRLTSTNPQKPPIVLDQFPVIVGVDPGADICLDDAAVGHYECMIDADDGTLTVWGLGAAGGTTVNGVPVVQKAPLASGDELGIGKSRFLVSVEDMVPAARATGESAIPHSSRRARRRELAGQV
jgi:pSer/pThr/pTyr-binding forkhead associated (FHA) protein